MKQNYLSAFSLRKIAQAVVSLFLLAIVAIPVFSQTADVKRVGVYYWDNPTSLDGMYCDMLKKQIRTVTETPPQSKTSPQSAQDFASSTLFAGIPEDVDIATASSVIAQNMRETISDGTVGIKFIDTTNSESAAQTAVTGGCTARAANTYYTKNKCIYYKGTLEVQSVSVTLYYIAQVTESYDGTTQVTRTYTEYGLGNAKERSFITGVSPTGNQNQADPAYSDSSVTTTSTMTAGDPWVSSALIEYDQPYPSSIPETNEYPNHCLAMCMDVYCNNFPMGQSTYSAAFPLQQIRFDVIKYYNNQNLHNADAANVVNTIDLFPGTENSSQLDPASYKCGSYRCVNGNAHNSEYTEWGECIGAKYVCDGSTANSLCYDRNTGELKGVVGGKNSGVCELSNDNVNKATGHSECLVFNDDGAPSHATSTSGGVLPITFCASWDGSYEHSGETGKSNGQFAFRASVHTDMPGDGVITQGNIQVDSDMIYPAMNQIPIQVDVTNVHTVRSTPTIVGKVTKVAAQPYTLVYRLSKDADVRIAVFDGATKDDAIYAYANDDGHSTNQTPGAPEEPSTAPVRTLVDWQPRLGEGMIGASDDKPMQEFENWDGRNDSGMLLPAGNYVVTIQAKSQDEWPGIDFSRAVTRQLSLDPLKLTDIRAVGLTKKSTAYATMTYAPTESSTVYWEIYTPGTVFGDDDKINEIDTNSAEVTGTGPKIKAGTGALVYRSEENRTGRYEYTSRWDGTCQNPNVVNGVPAPCEWKVPKGATLYNGQTCTNNNGCPQTVQNGAPMPDGNYVYVLWAEVPYNGKYLNLAGGGPKFVANAVCSGTGDEINNQCFTGVKTLKYNVGTLEVERGLVGITIQPVSYSTVGSSPTAYGLDPFIFKYALDRDAQAIASVQNTAGVVVRYLTPQSGTANVSQQLNTLSWDGRDEQGRMVAPGTYWFVVEAKDAMFPAMSNRASAVFPVDMYRLVDLTTTDVYGDSNARATISYLLSKAMNVQVNIYNKDVVIPNYNSTTGDYNDAQIIDTATSSITSAEFPSDFEFEGQTLPLTEPGTKITLSGNKRYTWTVVKKVDGTYYASVRRDTLDISQDTAAWPPRICNKTDPIFTGGHVDPSKVAQNHVACIYVNDESFINYPSTLADAADGVVDVRLQPIKTFDRTSLKNGDGMLIMEEWDALYFYNPQKCSVANTTNPTDCIYETLPDGQYPFFVSARSNEPFSRYYYDKLQDGVMAGYTLTGEPFKNSTDVVQMDYLYATDKPVSKINVTRGPVYFLEGSVAVYPNAPQVFNASTGPVFIPPYEINFAVSRASEVEIAIVALKDNVCSPAPLDYTTSGVNATNGDANNLYPNQPSGQTQSSATNANGRELKTNVAGQICKFLSTMTIANVGDFDANTIRKTYWDGTDHTGHYVTPGIYEVRLTARNYPNNNAYQPTVKSVPVNAQLFQVYDLLESDSYAISQRNTDMHIGYQVSVPMKVAVQIFKPGTTIYDYSKGTLRNPTTGKEVQDIHEVLVRSIVGIRPSMTLIDEIWDGRDYAQQEVPDGTYPFRFVTSINSADIDTMTGEIIPGYDKGNVNSNNADINTDASSDWKINYVADTYQYQNLHKATVAIGDGRFVCEDWEKTVIFYPNPLKEADKGTLEITKMPVPGTVSIKYYNLAGDLVKDSGYECIDANNYVTTMGKNLMFYPDNDPAGSTALTEEQLKPESQLHNVRNAAMRCKWNATNQHGKKVARGVYFGLVDFKAKAGREHCQKVVKIIVP